MTPGALVVLADMADLVEIDLAWRAVEFGETEPLIQRLLSHGLATTSARETVARLARGQALRSQGRQAADPQLAERDHLIRMLVANQRGLLRRAGKSEKRAAGNVERILQSDPAAHRIRQIVAAGGPSLAVDIAYALGLEGVELAP